MEEKQVVRVFKVRTLSGLSLLGSINDSYTADQFWQSLPFVGWINRYGREIYVDVELLFADLEDDATDLVEFGAVTYQPGRNKLSIFAGPTPCSRSGEEIRASAIVNVIGGMRDDAGLLLNAEEGAPVYFEKVRIDGL